MTARSTLSRLDGRIHGLCGRGSRSLARAATPEPSLQSQSPRRLAGEGAKAKPSLYHSLLQPAVSGKKNGVKGVIGVLEGVAFSFLSSLLVSLFCVFEAVCGVLSVAKPAFGIAAGR